MKMFLCNTESLPVSGCCSTTEDCRKVESYTYCTKAVERDPNRTLTNSARERSLEKRSSAFCAIVSNLHCYVLSVKICKFVVFFLAGSQDVSVNGIES